MWFSKIQEEACGSLRFRRRHVVLEDSGGGMWLSKIQEEACGSLRFRSRLVVL